MYSCRQESRSAADAIRARPLTIACWSAAHGRIGWATAVERLDETERLAEQIANRAHQAFAGQ
jgi:hypothetical protein